MEEKLVSDERLFGSWVLRMHADLRVTHFFLLYGNETDVCYLFSGGCVGSFSRRFDLPAFLEEDRGGSGNR